ncbi:type IV pilin-like G/H family protein, partial [Microcoleus sp. SVA1_B6]
DCTHFLHFSAAKAIVSLFKNCPEYCNYGVSKQELKSCIGGVFVVPGKEVDAKAAKNKMTTASILCQADSAGTSKPAEPTYENGKIACGKGTTEVTK